MNENTDVSNRCLIGKIFASKRLNRQAMTSILTGAWKTRKPLTIAPWNDNVFLFTFEDLEDRKKILAEAPWTVMGNMLLLQPLAVDTPAAEIEFRWAPFWVQAHGLPPEKLTKSNGEMIGQKFGRLVRVEAHTEGLLLYRSFLRIRMEIDVTRPLPKGFFLKRKGDCLETVDLWISFKYEKLADFCYDCGRIGHVNSMCKFVSREEAQAAGFGPDMRTGTAGSTGIPIEHYRRQVDTAEVRLKKILGEGFPRGACGVPDNAEAAGTEGSGQSSGIEPRIGSSTLAPDTAGLSSEGQHSRELASKGEAQDVV